jgi:ribosomal protein L37AE/L43A
MRLKNLERICPICKRWCDLERVGDNLLRCSTCQAAFYVMPDLEDAAVQDNAPRWGGALWR